MPLRVSKTEYDRESASQSFRDKFSVKVRRRDREERTKTLETKKREKNFGCDEESVMEESTKKRKWERKKKRKKKCSVIQGERTKEARERTIEK